MVAATEIFFVISFRVCLKKKVIKSSQQSLKTQTVTGFFYFLFIFNTFFLCTTFMHYYDNFILFFNILKSIGLYNLTGNLMSKESKINFKSLSSISLNL